MPALMNTDSRRKASAAYHAKRTEAGLRKVTLWLSPEARDALDVLKVEHGSKDAAANAAILAALRSSQQPREEPLSPTGGGR